MKTARGRAVLLLVLCCALWGLSFPGGKVFMLALEQELPGRDSWVFSSLTIGGRFGLSALLLALFLPRALWQMTALEWRQGLGLGVCGGFGMLVQSDGLIATEASTSAFLTQFTAVLVPLWIVLRHRRLPPPLTLGCVALVMVGVAVLGRLDVGTLRLGRGELETLISAVFFAAQILWLEKPIFRGNHAGRVTFVMFSVVALVNAAVFLAHAHAPSDAFAVFANAPLFALFSAGAVLCSLFAFLLMNRYQPEVDATTAGIVYCTEPLFATAFALFLPTLLAAGVGVSGVVNETVTPHLLLGGTLITLANLLIALWPPAKLP